MNHGRLRFWFHATAQGMSHPSVEPPHGPEAYEKFQKKEDGFVKVLLHP